MSSAGRIEGKVKWYDEDKGYGFITLPGGGLDIFVHARQLRLSGIERSLLKDESVSFVSSKGPKGTFATDVRLLGD